MSNTTSKAGKTRTRNAKAKATAKVPAKGKAASKLPSVLTATQTRNITTFVETMRDHGKAGRTLAHLFHDLVRPARGKGLDVKQTRALLNAKVREANVVHSNPAKVVGEAMRAAQVTDAVSVAIGKRVTPNGMTDDQWLMVSAAAKSEGSQERALKQINKQGRKALTISASDVKATGQTAARLNGKGKTGKGNAPDAPLTFDSLVAEFTTFAKAGKFDFTAKSITAWEALVKTVDDAIAKHEGTA